MGAVDIEKALGSKLPSPLTVENGDQIGIEWQPSYEAFRGSTASGNEAPPAPYGTFQFLSHVPIDQFLRDTPVQTTQTQTDTITFNTGTDVYQVTQRAIDNTQATILTATVGGFPATLTEDTDYEVHSTADYTTNDAVKFLDGGTKPDDGTTFTIQYEHILFTLGRVNHERYTYRLMLFIGNLASGTNGATKTYPKSYLARQLGEALVEEWMKLRGTSMTTTPGELRVGSIISLTDLPPDRSESLYRIAMDVALERDHHVTFETQKAAGKTTQTSKDLDSGNTL